MHKSPLVLSLAATLALGAIANLSALAETPLAAPVAAPAPTQPAVVPSVLGSLADQAATSVALSDHPFESLSGGITVRYPAGSKPLRQVANDEIMEFRDDVRKSSMVIARKAFPSPMILTAAKDGHGQMQPGIMEQTEAAVSKQYGDPELMKKGLPGLRVLRQDRTNLGNYDVAMLVFRYTKDAERRFVQTAIIEANDQLFYTLSLNTPGRKDIEIPLNAYGEEASEDPGERQAVETFRRILDSVKLLDRKQIYDDQVERLFRTRSLLQNWTARKVLSTLLPEQFMRILREDKPGVYTEVGCRYIVEEPDRKGMEDGIKVGIHTIFSEMGPADPTLASPRSEKEEWLSVSVDRKHEDWSRTTVLNNGTAATPGHSWPKLVEFGTSDLKTSRFLLVNPKKIENQYEQGTNEDPHQPWVGTHDTYTLNVQYVGTMGNQDPVTRPLPVFYLPQALDSMLPRLIPPNEAKSYLLATYVTDAREVMLRYVEVKPAQQVTLAGRTFQAIPITDHIGVEGSVTTNYVSPTGQFLGSENKDTKIIVIPTDRETIAKIWPKDKLHPPGDPGIAPTAVQDLDNQRGPARPNPAGPAGRGGITIGPGAPFDVSAPSRNGQSPGDSIVPEPVLPERPARDQK